MNTKQKIAYNTAAQLVGKAATTLTTLLLTVLITRRFGPSGYGDFTIMMAYSALFYIIADFGLNAIALRDFGALPTGRQATESKISHYFKNLIGLRLMMSLALFAIGAIALVFFPYSHFVKIGVLIGLLTIFTQALYSSTNSVFQARMRYDLSVLAAIFGSAAILGLSFLTISRGGSLLPIVGSYVVGGGVMVVVSLFFVRRLTGVVGVARDSDLWRYLFLAALPLGITTVFSVVLQKADALLLSILSGSEAVGLYGASYKIFEFALVFPTFFVNSIYPVMVRHLKGGGEGGRVRLLRTVKSSGLFLFAVSVLGSVVGYALAPWVIQVVAGPEFIESVQALRLLLLGLPIFYLSALFLWLLITLGKQKQIPFIYAAGAIVNVVLNFILIPHYSFHASAIITWTSELLILGLLIYFSRRALR